MIYTSGDWMVKPGREEEFIEAWHDLAEWTAAEIAPGAPAMLLRDRDEPAHFRSFGPWDSDEQVAAWRESEGFLARIGRIRDFSSDSRPTPWMWSLSWAARCREAWIASQCPRSLYASKQ